MTFLELLNLRFNWLNGLHVTDGDGVAFYYEGDLGDSHCGSTGDRERDTWDDWCDSAFHNGYGGFPPDADEPQPPVMFSNQLFWVDDIAEPPRMWPDGENAPVSTSPVLVGTLMPFMPPDTDRPVRLDNSELDLLDSRIYEFSGLSLGTGDTFIGWGCAGCLHTGCWDIGRL